MTDIEVMLVNAIERLALANMAPEHRDYAELRECIDCAFDFRFEPLRALVYIVQNAIQSCVLRFELGDGGG